MYYSHVLFSTGVIRIWRSLQHVFLRVTSDFAELPEELEPEERIELIREIMDQVCIIQHTPPKTKFQCILMKPNQFPFGTISIA